MKYLAPEIIRQRMIIEGYPAVVITDSQIKDYLAKLSTELGMPTLIEPITHLSETFGWAGWIHWETSGAHFYAWEHPRLFFSVDIYTCKAFDHEKEHFLSPRITFKQQKLSRKKSKKHVRPPSFCQISNSLWGSCGA